MIALPTNIEIHESPGGTWWIDTDGILYSLGKKDAPKQTREESEKEMEKFQRIIGDRKICMILDISHAKPTDKEQRDRAADQLEKVVKAMAMVTTSPLGKMVANLFFELKPPAYPVKIFNNLKDAQEWITPYANSGNE